jgi:hypothetical protein
MSTLNLITPNAIAAQVLEELRIKNLGQDMVFRTITMVLEKNGILVTDWNRKLVWKRIRRAIKKSPRITRFIPRKTPDDHSISSADACTRWENDPQEIPLEESQHPIVRIAKNGQFFFDLEHQRSA